jgi:hypothetical protein
MLSDKWKSSLGGGSICHRPKSGPSNQSKIYPSQFVRIFGLISLLVEIDFLLVTVLLWKCIGAARGYCVPPRGSRRLGGRVRTGGAMRQARGALQAQTWGEGQVRVHRHTRSVRVCQVHDSGLARLPPTPTHLLVDNEDGRSDSPR